MHLKLAFIELRRFQETPSPCRKRSSPNTITWADNDLCDFTEADRIEDYQECGPGFRGYYIYHQRDLTDFIRTNWKDVG